MQCHACIVLPIRSVNSAPIKTHCASFNIFYSIPLIAFSINGFRLGFAPKLVYAQVNWGLLSTYEYDCIRRFWLRRKCTQCDIALPLL